MPRTNDEIYDLLAQVAGSLGVVVTPTEPPKAGLVFPSGNIKSAAPNGSTRWASIPWTQVSRWEPIFSNTGAAEGVAPILLIAFALVESNAQHFQTGATTGTRDQVIIRASDAYDTVPAVGMFQVKLGYHGISGVDGYTPAGNATTAARLLASSIKQHGSWEAALKKVYFPGDDVGSGVTQQGYIDAIRRVIAELKAVNPDPKDPNPVPTSKNPFPKPRIEDLATAYEKYGITKWEAAGIIDNCFTDRSGGYPAAIVNHIQDGNTAGSLQWWARGVGVQASSTVMVNRDGTVLRIVPEQHGPWTNGDVCDPTPKSAALRGLGGNPNCYSLTIEAEGEPGDLEVTYTDTQLKSILWQNAEWMINYDLTIADVLSHASLNQCSRPRCPGEKNMLAILDGLKKAGFK